MTLMPAKVADEKAPVSSRADQHPALHGDTAGEVEQRSADGSEGTTFRKTFVMPGPLDNDHPQHEHNCVRVLEEAVQRGLHAKGKARHVGTDEADVDRRGVVSIACHYEVPVVPAVVDTEAHKTVTPSSDVRVTGRHAPTAADA